MILCDEPYLNEPAWAKSAGTPQSKQCQSIFFQRAFRVILSYYQTLPTSDGWWFAQRYVLLSYALRLCVDWLWLQMLGNLKNPPEPFADVIRTHFRLKARSILKQLDEWVQLDDSKGLAADGAYAGQGGGKNVPSSSGTNGFADDVEELKGLLRKLQAGRGIVEPSSSS